MARQGIRFVVFGALIALIGVAKGAVVVVALGVLFAAFCVYFYRDPERALPTDASKIYSPGDGVVLSIGQEESTGGQTIRIFLSIFDVHIQRSPCAGRVAGKLYVPGSFRAAMKDEAKGNERSVLTLEPSGHEAVAVEQIAGLIARRIETWPETGAQLAAGERYGIIYFGSQAAVRLPASARPTVKVGERVTGGVTPVAEWI